MLAPLWKDGLMNDEARKKIRKILDERDEKRNCVTEKEFLENRERIARAQKVVRYWHKGKWHEIPIKEKTDDN